MNDNRNIKDLVPITLANFLLQEHGFGVFRNKEDLDLAKAHSLRSLNLVHDILLNIDGTVEDKVSFIEKAMEELEKFKIKEERTAEHIEVSVGFEKNV